MPDPVLHQFLDDLTLDESKLVLHGLRIRGIRAESRKDRWGGFAIAVPELQTKLARESLPYIWIAIYGRERGVDRKNRCGKCAYELGSLPDATTCPECGIDLMSAKALRLAVKRDGNVE